MRQNILFHNSSYKKQSLWKFVPSYTSKDAKTLQLHTYLCSLEQLCKARIETQLWCINNSLSRRHTHGWFQISWAPTTSNKQNIWSIYMLENHAVTRTIHSSSNKSDSDKHLHSIPKFAISFLPHCCPPTNHFPHLLRPYALYKDHPTLPLSN